MLTLIGTYAQTTAISTLSLHDALPICGGQVILPVAAVVFAEVADVRLLAFAELEQMRAELLHFAPAGSKRRNLYDQAGDARVVPSSVNRIGQIVQQGGAAGSRRLAAHGPLLINRAPHVEHQHRSRGQAPIYLNCRNHPDYQDHQTNQEPLFAPRHFPPPPPPRRLYEQIDRHRQECPSSFGGTSIL